MTDQTSAELEQEAELARARIADTADSLRNKMSPGQMVDEVASYFRGSDGGMAFSNLTSQLRDNPIPAALVGIGLAWLFASSGSSAKTASAPARSRSSAYNWDDSDWDSEDDSTRFGQSGRDRSYAESVAAAGSGAADAVSSAASSIGGAMRSAASGASSAMHGAAGAMQDAAGMASDAAGSVASGLSSAAAGLGGAARSASRTASRTTHNLSEGSKRMGSYAQKQFSDVLSQEPLVLAAIGVAVGAAIGAAFPATNMEDEALGEYSDKLREKVGDTAHAAMEQASDLANEAYGNLKDAARDAGLGEQGAALADSVTSVMQDTVESVKNTIGERLGSGDNGGADENANGEGGVGGRRSNPV